MSTTAIRQKLHSYLAIADDKKVKAIYAIMEADIKNAAITYTDDLKEELDKRYSEYKSGKVKAVSSQESKKRIEKLLQRKAKK